MKKLLSSLLCLAMLLPFAACNGDPQDSQSQSSSSSSSSDSSSDSQTGPKVITAESFDPMGYEYASAMGGIFTKDKLYVSEMLKEAMEEHEGEDVLFRVIVDIASESKYDTDEDGNVIEIEKDTECYDLAISVGATNIELIDLLDQSISSDIYPRLSPCFFMEIPGEGLKQMIDHKGYAIRLAPPKRVDGYDARIADILTVELNSMNDGDLLHVAVASCTDARSEYAMWRGIPHNGNYNSDLVTLLKKVDVDDIKEYIDAILERNGIAGKRVYNPEAVDYTELLWEVDVYNGIAGFEAELTKAEILALAEDPDVKVIYSMTYAGIQWPVAIDA